MAVRTGVTATRGGSRVSRYLRSDSWGEPRIRHLERSRSLRYGAQVIRNTVGESPSLLDIVRLKAGRRDPHPKVALAVLSFGQIADQRQQRQVLATSVGEVSAADERAALCGAEGPYGAQ